MITFKTLSIRNFLSYGNNTTVFQLNNPGTMLIVGEDLDHTSEGQGSNGVGKTSMLQALIYALYDRIIDPDVAKDDLVNNINKKEMEVTLEFTAENGLDYKIIRQRKMKAGADGNRLFLFENDKDISVDVAGTNKKIEEVLGMAYDLFVRIIVFSASNDSFLKLPATSTSGPNQKDFIEELFGLSLITQKADRLKLLIKDVKMEMELKKVQLDSQQAERTRHKQQLAQSRQRQDAWEVQRSGTISLLESKLAKIDGVDVVGQKLIHAKLSQVTSSRTDITSKRTAIIRECNGHGATIKKLDSDISVLQDNKCPHCKQPYSNALIEVQQKMRELEAIEAELEEMSTQLTDYTELLTDLDALYVELNAQKTVDNIEEIVRIQSDADNIRSRVVELRQEVNPHIEIVQELEAITFDDVNYDSVQALQRTLDHQNFLLKLLTKNDSFVRKSLLTKYLPFLNSRLQFYLQMLGLPHVVEFQEDLTPKISKNEVKMKFGQLSTGQKARADFGFSVAFKDVRERLHGRTNICMFDEVLDFGLDAVGVVACAKVIKYLARAEHISMYVISHRNEIDSMFDRKMTVQMIKQFSYIQTH